MQPPTPTAVLDAQSDTEDGASTLTLKPASGPPGTRVQIQWSGEPPFKQGSAYWDGTYLTKYKRCSLGLCGPPWIGVISIPKTKDAEPGPYQLGISNGQQLVTAIWMMTR